MNVISGRFVFLTRSIQITCLTFDVVTRFQITIHEFGASWNRRSSKKAISVCALFCVRGHSEVCILKRAYDISSIAVVLLKGFLFRPTNLQKASLFQGWKHSRSVKCSVTFLYSLLLCSMFASTLTMRGSVRSRYFPGRVTWQTLLWFFSERRWAGSTLCLR